MDTGLALTSARMMYMQSLTEGKIRDIPFLLWPGSLVNLNPIKDTSSSEEQYYQINYIFTLIIDSLLSEKST